MIRLEAGLFVCGVLMMRISSSRIHKTKPRGNRSNSRNIGQILSLLAWASRTREETFDE